MNLGLYRPAKSNSSTDGPHNKVPHASDPSLLDRKHAQVVSFFLIDGDAFLLGSLSIVPVQNLAYTNAINT